MKVSGLHSIIAGKRGMDMSKKVRTGIPADIAAKLMFLSDRTCCVCRMRNKPVQIHHIDENPSNNNIENLSTLCFDCHNDTMIKGGFGRKLNADQVILYRNDWLEVVKRIEMGLVWKAYMLKQ